MSLGYDTGRTDRWFAWHPVWTDKGPRWLCYVTRREMFMPDWDEPWNYWEYDAL